MKKIINLMIILMVLSGCGNKKNIEEQNKIDTSEYYNTYVKTNKEAIIYEKCTEENCSSEYKEIGKINQNFELSLDGIFDEYFKINNLDNEYYIKYTDVDKIDNLTDINNRYEKYIPWNKNIITKEITRFYDENNQNIITINKSYNLPIIIDDSQNNKYYVKFINRLLYIPKDDVIEIKENENTTEKNIEGIAVLNYHFIFKPEEATKCNEILCVSEKQFSEHLQFIKDNNYFTPTMKELEMYMDGKLQLPKSVVITADDGGYATNFRDLLDKYQLNGTLFLITSWFNPTDFASEYLEVHSHGDNLHNTGVCPGGQGGAIKCLPHDELMNDLQTTRNKLNGSTVFCYPFYEYNDYSIQTLKEAGFTMAFAGEYDGGDIVARPGGNKFEIPRWVMVNYTTMNDFKTYLELKIA